MKRDIKREIIETTIRLIQEKNVRPEKITVRDICGAAGVGISQINYHFQTKENLIAQCVQVMIGDVIDAFPKVLSLSEATAVDTLKRAMLGTLNYLYSNVNISRISILSDHQDARQGDNTAQTVDAYLPLVEAVCRVRNIRDDPKKLTTLMLLALQGMFLRTNVVKDTLGIDMRNETERAKFVDEYIERIFRE
jgi:AcrR family transcriptional regulator